MIFLNGLKDTQLKPENVIRAAFEDVEKFSGEAPQFDDETMVCFIYNGKYFNVIKSIK